MYLKAVVARLSDAVPKHRFPGRLEHRLPSFPSRSQRDNIFLCRCTDQQTAFCGLRWAEIVISIADQNLNRTRIERNLAGTMGIGRLW